MISILEKNQNSNRSVDPQLQATHVITGIDFGIDLIAVLQLPPENNIIIQIDDILNKISYILSTNNDQISSKEKNLLKEIVTVTIYSNIPTLTGLRTLSDLLYQLDRFKGEFNCCHPITYNLRPTEWLNPQYRSTNAALRIIPKEIKDYTEQYLLRLRNQIRYAEAWLKQNISTFLYGPIQDQIVDARYDQSTLKDRYKKLTKLMSSLIIDIRKGRHDPSIIYQILKDNEQITLQTNTQQLIKNVHELERKRHSNDVSESQEYFKENHQNDDFMSQNYTSNDTKNSLKSNDVNQLQFDTYTNNYDRNSKSTGNTITSSSPIEEINTPLSNNIDNAINILLVGETGVGKSTFINAFINYLSFDSLDLAQLNKPHVIIPVSFLMTIGENFDEQIVKFTDVNNCKNEDFNHPGQSVTQHCKSYLFNLKDGRKLCLIDTPGLGDTRGIDQDERNLDHILKYLQNLTHLNGICFLLKPNSSKLNVFFRRCFNQLFDFLGENLFQNLIFCFTNSRSTFYTPGDTTPLIKTMFASLSINSIELKKENTFCFDSEAFRYLVARQNQIEFNDHEKQEYDMSWKISMKESFRLIDYIRTKLPLNILNHNWKSNKHALFEINQLIRPILETMRNILRNIIILFNNQSIELYSTIIHRPAFICYSCTPKLNLIANFWIIEDTPHEFQNECQMCTCTQNNHTQINYLLNYKLINNYSKNRKDEMNEQLNILSHGSTAFAYFLLYIIRSTKEDPFFIGITRMIEEETKICKQYKSNNLNLKLVEELSKLKENYRKQFNEIELNKDQNNLEFIYKWIKKINEIKMINEQMKAVKKTQEILMKQHEIDPIDI
ncbi:unnamed protein product [Adineta steineri]|uniref:G domain-containing protein n=1 Tax=Adineta steineri TaxID=433720 RepID=A0A814DPV3_9BILA|nr:unnamed protein product [Adineta steineri]CAF3758827.1 unnamed protein product [Adineta steineri]